MPGADETILDSHTTRGAWAAHSIYNCDINYLCHYVRLNILLHYLETRRKYLSFSIVNKYTTFPQQKEFEILCFTVYFNRSRTTILFLLLHLLLLFILILLLLLFWLFCCCCSPSCSCFSSFSSYYFVLPVFVLFPMPFYLDRLETVLYKIQQFPKLRIQIQVLLRSSICCALSVYKLQFHKLF